MPRQFGVPSETISKVCKQEESPSVYSPYLEPLHGRHVIGVNNAYQLGEWVDMLFFGDHTWYDKHRTRIVQWPGTRASCAPIFSRMVSGKIDGVKYLRKDKGKKQGISHTNGTVVWNSNSGAAAISMARHLGVKRILLLGFDMCGNGQYTHWHGSHGKGNNPPFKKHLEGFPAIAEDARRLRLEILNVSPDSRIEALRKVRLEEVL